MQNCTQILSVCTSSSLPSLAPFSPLEPLRRPRSTRGTLLTRARFYAGDRFCGVKSLEPSGDCHVIAFLADPFSHVAFRLGGLPAISPQVLQSSSPFGRTV